MSKNSKRQLLKTILVRTKQVLILQFYLQRKTCTACIKRILLQLASTELDKKGFLNRKDLKSEVYIYFNIAPA